MTLTTYHPDRIAPVRTGQVMITGRKAAAVMLDREVERLALEAEQGAEQAWTRPVDAGYRFAPTGWVDPDGTCTTLDLLGRGGWEPGSHVSAAQQTAAWQTLAEREDDELRSLLPLLGAAGQVPDRELDAARHEPTSLLVERRLAGLVLALHAPEPLGRFAPGGAAADRPVVARIAPQTLRAVVAAREAARGEWALDHTDALLEGVVACLALRRRVARLGRARLREQSFAELVLRVRVQLAQVGRLALAGRLSDVAVGRALVRAEVGLCRLLAEGDGEVWRTAPTEPLCPGLRVVEEGPLPAWESWLVCAARDDLAYRHGGAEPRNRPVSGRGHHRSARPGVGHMAGEAHQSATAEPAARGWPVEVDQNGAAVLDAGSASPGGGEVLALPGMPATCERCWAEPAVAFGWWLPPGLVGERCRAELASRSGPIVIRRSG